MINIFITRTLFRLLLEKHLTLVFEILHSKHVATSPKNIVAG